jgi:hypothetical protein
VSVGEDVGTVGLSYLSLAHPVLTFFIMLVLLTAVIVTLPILVRTLRMLLAAVISKLFGFLGGRGNTETSFALSPSEDAFFARPRVDDETIVWAGRGYAGRITGMPRSAKILVVVSNRSIHFLYRRLRGFRHNHLRLDDIRQHKLYPGRFFSKLVIVGSHETWSMQFFPRVSRSLPSGALDSLKDTSPTDGSTAELPPQRLT